MVHRNHLFFLFLLFMLEIRFFLLLKWNLYECLCNIMLLKSSKNSLHKIGNQLYNNSQWKMCACIIDEAEQGQRSGVHKHTYSTGKFNRNIKISSAVWHFGWSLATWRSISRNATPSISLWPRENTLTVAMAGDTLTTTNNVDDEYNDGVKTYLLRGERRTGIKIFLLASSILQIWTELIIYIQFAQSIYQQREWCAASVQTEHYARMI